MSVAANLRKFIQLEIAEMGGLLRVVLLLTFARAGLSVLGFRGVKIALTPIRVRSCKNESHQEAAIKRVVWLLTMARRHFVRQANCLPTSLVLHSLLSARGVSTEFRIGVRKTTDGRLEAHAWIEQNGRLIVMKNMDDESHFIPFAAHIR